MTSASTQAKIGTRLREARAARRLTLDAVAAGCGVTKGYLSKLERDNAVPSVATLVRICSTLDIDIGSLFDTAPVGELVRAGSMPRVSFGGENMTEYLLSPTGERRIQVLLSEIEPGGGSGTETYSLPADIAFVHVLSGALTMSFDDDATEVVLGGGDAFTFSPRRRHSFRAGSAGARVTWTLSPALPDRKAAS